MLLSKRLEKLGRGTFARYDCLKADYIARNHMPKLIDLSLGSTDLLPPSNVLEAISKALTNPKSSRYSLYSSTREFREAVSAWIQNRFDVTVDPDREVLLLIGSQEGTAHLPMTLIDPGQIGLILDPSYPSHQGGLALASAEIQRLVLRSEDNWRPNFQDLTPLELDQTRMMLLGFPHNPTAQVGDQTLLDEVMELGARHQIAVVHDNPYVDLALDGQAPALIATSGWRDWGIELFSFSKGWCMGGFRIAFAVGAEPLISALRELKGVIDFNQSTALQIGAIEALTNNSDWPNKILGVYRERRDKTISALSKLGWNVPVPSMAMYLWMPLPDWAKESHLSDEDFAVELLQNSGIALTPGSGFGSGGKGWLRLALVRPVDELEAAIKRMTPWWNEQS